MFPNAYRRPYEKDYLPRTENVTVYSYYEKHRNDDDSQYCEYCDEELGCDENGEYEDCNCEDAQDEKSGFPKLSQVTLQSILDMLPEGVKPADVNMSINLDTGDMGVYGQEVTFSYKKAIKDDPEGFELAKKKYEENYKAYLVEKQKYDTWAKEQQVKELEDKLTKLKSG